MTTKHLFFYSNYCNYSNEIFQKIVKYNLKDHFYLLNISKKKYNIPSIITKVPTLLLNDKKTIFQDDELEKFIEEINKKLNKNDIMPNNDTSISSPYSFWNEDENENKLDFYNSFELLNGNNTSIITPEDESNNSNKITGNINDKLSNMQENRNLDIQKIFKDVKPGQNIIK